MPLRFGARMFLLTCSCFTGIAPRCSQCLLDLCSTITLNAALARLFPFARLGNGFAFCASLGCLAVCRVVSSVSFLGLAHFTSIVPLGLTRLTLDDCLVVLVTDGLMPQGARVTKKAECWRT